MAGYLLRGGITALFALAGTLNDVPITMIRGGEASIVHSKTYTALAETNINALSISTSMSSVSCVFDQSRLDDAVAALKETFQLS